MQVKRFKTVVPALMAGLSLMMWYASAQAAFAVDPNPAPKDNRGKYGLTRYVYVREPYEKYTPRSIGVYSVATSWQPAQYKCFSVANHDYFGREFKSTYKVPTDTLVYVSLFGPNQQNNSTCAGVPYKQKSYIVDSTKDKNKYIYFMF